ncbi:hypothetical protein BJ965_003559 [Streptomyces luteogriseus]|uniref:Uncharacterized protein n=1 Tax=Streptomyces luteogriseus TaxID=68233 RepID=A0A7W7DN22_9ACTN|nr:hypothetical protein [Streptomyces luteogriseus]MBB4713677.1 hypothetical protein [Streptomyces luteogriseus]
MADPQSNARLRADAGAPTTGVIHVRTRLTADFTVISNALAQRRGSAVTVGVAAYIASLPDGSPVTIAALCEHFSEGEILISRALRELVLSAHEAARLAPAVAEWLAAGVGQREITELLTARLPDRFRARPASVLAFRLRETPLPLPSPAPLPPSVERPAVLPFQTCDGCERAFRAPGPGHCRSCRDRLGEQRLRAAG